MDSWQNEKLNMQTDTETQLKSSSFQMHILAALHDGHSFSLYFKCASELCQKSMGSGIAISKRGIPWFK